MNKQLATPALFLGLLATGLFVWVDMFRYGYPPKITLLTVRRLGNIAKHA